MSELSQKKKKQTNKRKAKTFAILHSIMLEFHFSQLQPVVNTNNKLDEWALIRDNLIYD